jgi:hypothetical protein
LDPSIKRGNYTAGKKWIVAFANHTTFLDNHHFIIGTEEDQIILEEQNRIGNRWSIVSLRIIDRFHSNGPSFCLTTDFCKVARAD